MQVTLKPVGLDAAAVVGRQVRELSSANRKVGNAVKKAGVAAIRQATPSHFGKYPLKVKGKIESAGGDHVDVRLYGTPVGFWSILTNGSKPHVIRPRKAKALSWGTGPKETVGVVHHPGTAGNGVWQKAEAPMRAAVKKATTDVYDVVFS